MIKNKHGISLPMAVMLAHDTYDYQKLKNYISVTTLIKPMRAIILGMQHKVEADSDLMDFVASRVGTAVHAFLEDSWIDGHYRKNLRKLGYDSDFIKKLRINPEKNDITKINMYLERRTIRSFNGYNVGGQADFIENGLIRDLKTVKAFSFKKDDNHDYMLQMSLYKWLNVDIVTEDIGIVDMLITDWKQYEAEADPRYPQTPIVSKVIDLMPLQDTRIWLENRLNIIDALKESPQSELPRCTNQELWKDATKYKFYGKPDAKRATKVFDNMHDANQRLIDTGSKGRIDIVEGKAKRCNYCHAAPNCDQYADLVAHELV